METVILKRQLITDATGKAVGVILPLEEYAKVASILENDFDAPLVESSPADFTSIREASFFGMWADRSDLPQSSSRAWLEELRQQQWKRT